MLKVVFDECYLAWSEELGLLRVLEVYIEDNKEYYYVLYYDKVLDLSNKQNHCDIAINNIVISVPSFSSFYSYHVFKTQKDMVQFLNNNDIFKILR